MKNKVLGAYVLVKEDPIEDNKTKSGIIIKGDEKIRTRTGRVLAVGAGFKTADGRHISLDFKVNDKVLYKDFTGIRNAENEVFLIASDVLAKIQ